MKDVYISPDRKERSEIHTAQDVVTGRETHGKKAALFSAYYENPTNIRFENQEKEERIVLFLRQHPVVNIPWLAVTLLLVAAPILLSFFPVFDFLPSRFQFVGVLVWYLLVFAYILENFLSWVFNIYIVTDRRIVDIDFFNLIHKQVSDAEIPRIQDVTYTLKGVVGTLFNYGDVLIQTAGTAPNFDFSRTPNPEVVVKILQELRRERERKNV